MKKIFFSLVVILGVSGSYGIGAPHSRPEGISQEEEALRKGFLLGVTFPQITRAQRISTLAGKIELNRQIQRGEAVSNRLSRRFGGGVCDLSQAVTREELADMYVYYNTFVPPELQIQEMITNTAPDQVIQVLVGRIVNDSEGDFVLKLTSEALRQLPMEQATKLMQALQTCGVLTRM